jgi:hypothetical protein
MVLHSFLCGRVGRCQVFKYAHPYENADGFFFYIGGAEVDAAARQRLTCEAGSAGIRAAA